MADNKRVNVRYMVAAAGATVLRSLSRLVCELGCNIVLQDGAALMQRMDVGVVVSAS